MLPHSFYSNQYSFHFSAAVLFSRTPSVCVCLKGVIIFVLLPGQLHRVVNNCTQTRTSSGSVITAELTFTTLINAPHTEQHLCLPWWPIGKDLLQASPDVLYLNTFQLWRKLRGLHHVNLRGSSTELSVTCCICSSVTLHEVLLKAPKSKRHPASS